MLPTEFAGSRSGKPPRRFCASLNAPLTVGRPWNDAPRACLASLGDHHECRYSWPHRRVRTTSTALRTSCSAPAGGRAADACAHAELAAKPEIGRSDSSASTSVHAFSLLELGQAFRAA